MMRAVALPMLLAWATSAARLSNRAAKEQGILQLKNMTNVTSATGSKSGTAMLKVLRTKNVQLTLASKMPNPWVDAVECYGQDESCTCANWGRWYPDGFTPAGCVANTLASVYALAKFVDGHGYTLELYGGSLLGAMRCGSFIPWDYDGDLKIKAPTSDAAWDIAAKINNWAGGPQKPASIWVGADGSSGVPGPTPWAASNPATTSGNVHLGLYVQVGSTEMIPCVLGDIVVHCPANYNEILTSKYGSDWNSVPKRWGSWEQQQLADSPLHLDEAKVDACKTRMSAINAALANMNL